MTVCWSDVRNGFGLWAGQIDCLVPRLVEVAISIKSMDITENYHSLRFFSSQKSRKTIKTIIKRRFITRMLARSADENVPRKSSRP